MHQGSSSSTLVQIGCSFASNLLCSRRPSRRTCCSYAGFTAAAAVCCCLCDDLLDICLVHHMPATLRNACKSVRSKSTLSILI
jgi:hypothetical protein